MTGLFAVVEAFGVLVVEVEDLTERGGPVMYLRAQQIALIDAGLDEDEREAAAGLVLSSVASGGAS